MLQVGDPASFLPVATGWLLIRIIKELHPAEFAWAVYPTHVNPSGKKHLDLLAGMQDAEALFEIALDDFAKKLPTSTTSGDWPQRIQPYLLYS